MILSLKLFLLCNKNQTSTSIPDLKSSHYEQNRILLYFNTLILDLTIRNAHFHSWLSSLISKNGYPHDFQGWVLHFIRKKRTSLSFSQLNSSLFMRNGFLHDSHTPPLYILIKSGLCRISRLQLFLLIEKLDLSVIFPISPSSTLPFVSKKRISTSFPHLNPILFTKRRKEMIKTLVSVTKFMRYWAKFVSFLV